MTTQNTPLIIIPARMAASRLPGKPLADIGGKPMIRHVWERAVASAIAPVWVACDNQEIADVIEAAGGNAVMTSTEHPSGSDRCHEALGAIDPDGRHDIILNLQGDLPEMDADVPARLLGVAAHTDAHLSTLVAPAREGEADLPQVVKVAVGWQGALSDGVRFGRALYFSRAPIPSGDATKYHHVGVYGWRRDALERFVELAPSPLEKSEKLEQLRALEAGMEVAVAEIERVQPGVDTDADLQAVRGRIG